MQLSGKLNPMKVFQDIGHHLHYLKLTLFVAFNVGIVANHGQIVRSSPTLEKLAIQTLDHGLRLCNVDYKSKIQFIIYFVWICFPLINSLPE